MEEIEVPTEHLHEHLEHEAEHGAPWINLVAVSTALVAAIAAVASLLAGAHANEAMIGQMKSSDQWAFFQAKSIKGHLTSTEANILRAMGRAEAAEASEGKVKKYEGEKDEIKEKAEHFEKEAEHHLEPHERPARSVTLCQIAIAIAAISALTKRKPFWYVSLAFGAVGAFFLFTNLMHSSGH